ncbi:MAG TPA: radical SAM protein [Candidatus Omnitrophota bacterium]|nr:radical SAM protein [Candidatus Omnitrophota bacterium]
MTGDNGILLVNLPWFRDGKAGVRAGSRWPHIKGGFENTYLPFPFFLAYASALLKKNGFKTILLDAVAENLSEAGFFARINKGFDLIVAETSIPSFHDDMAILKKIADIGIRIILCGPNSNIFKEDFLLKYDFISYVMVGEYEETLLELMKALKDNKDVSSVAGLIYRQGKEIKKSQNRALLDIDSLPWPQRDGLPMQNYLDVPGAMPMPSVQMVASRGCPFKCAFCLWPQVMYGGNSYRVRQVKDVVDEMEYLVVEKGFKSVYFDDDTFNVGKERMLSFCGEIKKRGLNRVPWAIMARPDLMDSEILKAMSSSGLWAVKYGLESSDQALLDSIGKNMDLKKAIDMISFSKKLGVRTHLTFTFGLPGETRETVKRTIELALKLDPFSVQFSITTPFPGTHYYQVLEKQGKIASFDLNEYDGQFNSVIELDGMDRHELKCAKAEAYRAWEEHVTKRAGSSLIKKFMRNCREKGLSYSIKRSIGYLKTKRG